MKIGLFSDAHGNALALGQALRLLRDRCERLFFLGDAIGYYPASNEVMGLIKDSGAYCLAGNHELMILGKLPLTEAKNKVYQLDGAWNRLSPEHRKWIATWEPSHRIELNGRKILLVHGSPNDPGTGYIYPDSDISSLNTVEQDVILMGHSHHAFTKQLDHVLVVNIGSCGLPRDHGGLGSFVVYDTDDNVAETFRFEIDRDAITATYGAMVHESVIKVLHREGPYYGKLLQ
jgi:putative phosphoesterase